jgi:hypothetical protein
MGEFHVHLLPSDLDLHHGGSPLPSGQGALPPCPGMVGILQCMSPASRYFLLFINFIQWRLLLAGLYPVEFRDFFLGDMYCSQTYAMGVSQLHLCDRIYANDCPEHRALLLSLCDGVGKSVNLQLLAFSTSRLLHNTAISVA